MYVRHHSSLVTRHLSLVTRHLAHAASGRYNRRASGPIAWAGPTAPDASRKRTQATRGPLAGQSQGWRSGSGCHGAPTKSGVAPSCASPRAPGSVGVIASVAPRSDRSSRLTDGRLGCASVTVVLTT